MNIETKHMGQIEVSLSDFLSFPDGLPGFENTRDYVLVKLSDDIPFSFLQSIQEKETSFIVTDPFLFFPDYNVQLDEGLLADLKIEKPEQVIILCIVRLNGTLESSTLNLLAPIVINSDAKIGKQTILQDSRYQVKQPLVTASKDRSDSDAGSV